MFVDTHGDVAFDGRVKHRAGKQIVRLNNHFRPKGRFQMNELAVYVLGEEELDNISSVGRGGQA